MDKVCPYCEKLFTPGRSHQKYCCRSCKTRAKDWRNGHAQKALVKLKQTFKPTYVIYKKSKCEFCGFIPVHSCQLDVDHIDGHHENNDPSNLQTLCANCHRLKTYINRDGVSPKTKEVA